MFVKFCQHICIGIYLQSIKKLQYALTISIFYSKIFSLLFSKNEYLCQNKITIHFYIRGHLFIYVFMCPFLSLTRVVTNTHTYGVKLHLLYKNSEDLVNLLKCYRNYSETETYTNISDTSMYAMKKL